MRFELISSCESLEPRRLFASSLTYLVTDLISDVNGDAPVKDVNAINSWGIGHSGTGPFWVANPGSGTLVHYNGKSGTQGFFAIAAPSPNADTGGAPTGLVYSESSAFKFTRNGETAAARYLACTEDGTVVAWNDNVPNGSHAELVLDNSAKDANYKGITVAKFNGKNFLYVTNFETGKVEVYDKDYHVAKLPGKFVDHNIPSGFVPFNIQNLNGVLYVTYAKKAPGADDETHGAGLGFIDQFNTNGTLLRRFAKGGSLNAPWGVTVSPHDFGKFSDDILVGNFGDGKISAFSPESGAFRGRLVDADGKAVKVDGLWGLTFGNGVFAGQKNELFFTAGPDDEAGGLFGKITAIE